MEGTFVNKSIITIEICLSKSMIKSLILKVVSLYRQQKSYDICMIM